VKQIQRELAMKIKTPKIEEAEETARLLRSELDMIKKDLSELRRAGYYTKSADNMLGAAWPKIRLYKATCEDSDLAQVKEIFKAAKAEMERIKNNEDNEYLKKED